MGEDLGRLQKLCEPEYSVMSTQGIKSYGQPTLGQGGGQSHSLTEET